MMLSNLLHLPKQYNDLSLLSKHYDKGGHPPQVLLFGDSVHRRVSDFDQDRRQLCEMISDAMYGVVLPVSGQAYTPELFYYLVLALERMRHRPEVVVLPVNIRCFSPQWDLNPAWQFHEEIGTIKQYLASPSKKIGKIRGGNTAIREPRYVLPRQSVMKGEDVTRIIASQPVREDVLFHRKQQLFANHYMYKLSRDHRKLHYFENTIILLNTMQITPYVYITPINADAGRKYNGEKFTSTVKENIATIT